MDPDTEVNGKRFFKSFNDSLQVVDRPTWKKILVIMDLGEHSKALQAEFMSITAP